MRRLKTLIGMMWVMVAGMLAAQTAAEQTVEYVTYDLTKPIKEAVSVPFSKKPSEIVRSDYTGTTMLFVKTRDPDGNIFYLGALEVTKTQALSLGFTNAEPSESEKGAAYASAVVSTVKEELRDFFSYPTEAQLKSAWGDEEPTAETRALYNFGVPLDTYWGEYTRPNDWNGQIDAKGYFDLLGNVAEYARMTETSGAFFGGHCQMVIAADKGAILLPTEPTYFSLADAGIAQGDYCGFRLVLTPPEETNFTLTVTLNGEPYAEQSGAYGTEVTLTPPALGDDQVFVAPVPTLPETITKTETINFVTQSCVNVTLVGCNEVGGKVAIGATLDMTSAEYQEGDIEPLWTITDAEGKALDWRVEGSAGRYTVQIPETTNSSPTTPGLQVVITSTPQYQVEIWLDGKYKDAKTFAKGSVLSVYPPTPASGYRIDPEKTTPSPMPETVTENLTIHYTSRAYVNLKVENGTATPSDPFLGESATLALHQADGMVEWGVPTGWTLSGDTVTVPTSGVVPGETYTITAVVKPHLVRVLVYNAVVSAKAEESLGNGYYRKGATLTLTPAVPEGGLFSHWEGANVVNNTYVADAAAEITAVFKADDTVEAATLHFGMGKTAAYENFGWRSGAVNEAQAGENTLRSPTYTERTETYVNVDLLAKTIKYEATPNNEAMQVLSLKRVKPEGKSAFYLGIYETSVAQMAYLAKPTDFLIANATAAEKAELANLAAATGSITTHLTDLENKVFAGHNTLTRLPTKEDIIAIGDINREDNPGAGKGYMPATGGDYFDVDITADMIWSGYQNKATPVTGYQGKITEGKTEVEKYTTVDPYGFYNLWGNYYEALGAGKSPTHSAGGVYIGDIAGCNLVGYSQYSIRAYESNDTAFRPLVPVAEAPITVTVEIDGASSEVTLVPGKPLVLADEAPVKAGYAFGGWQWRDGVAVTAETLATAEDDGKTLIATFTEKTLEGGVTITYEGDIKGPEALYPGGTSLIYTSDLSLVQVSDGLTLDAETGMLSLKVGVTSPQTVSLQGAVVAPGYTFRLQ